MMLNKEICLLLDELDTLLRGKLKLKGDINFAYRDPFGLEFPIKKDTDPSVIDQVKQERIGGTFTIENNGNNVASFALCSFPNNAYVIITHSTYIQPKYQEKGLGTLLCKLKEEFVKCSGGYGMVGIVNPDNKPQRRIMEKQGWIPSEKPKGAQTWTVMTYTKYF
jgi:hypothetical protein